MDSRQHRPSAVTLVAVFLSLAATIALVTGLSLLAPGTRLDRIWTLNPRAYAAFARGGLASGVLLLVVCGAAAAAARGLLRRRRWAWALAIGIFGINGLGDLANLALTRAWLKAGAGMLVAALFLALLLRADVRTFFAEPA
ncbi:MAG TPA: hypothetical protein VHZ09_11220 [Acidobacteriaceae bacterium]|nr:hypothetical protein [Acidobacteriaceae bacterium]